MFEQGGFHLSAKNELFRQLQHSNDEHRDDFQLLLTSFCSEVISDAKLAWLSFVWPIMALALILYFPFVQEVAKCLFSYLLAHVLESVSYTSLLTKDDST